MGHRVLYGYAVSLAPSQRHILKPDLDVTSGTVICSVDFVVIEVSFQVAQRFSFWERNVLFLFSVSESEQIF